MPGATYRDAGGTEYIKETHSESLGEHGTRRTRVVVGALYVGIAAYARFRLAAVIREGTGKLYDNEVLLDALRMHSGAEPERQYDFTRGI